MEGADAPLLSVLAAMSTLAQYLEAAANEHDGPPPSVRITQASRATWSAIFRKHILGATRVGDADDLLFFVRVPENQDEPFYALRHDSKQLPPPESADVNWEETCYLNLIMHNLEYTMEVSVRQRKWSVADSKFVSTSLKKLSKKVWAAPNHVRLDGHLKAEAVELTYPFVYFRVDDYEEIWRDVQLQQPDQIIAVELFAHGPMNGATRTTRHKLFSGALSYEAVLHAVKEKSSSFSLTGPAVQHFFKLRGPHGKGTAQLCVKRANAATEASAGFGAWALNLLRVNGDAEVSGPFVCSITWLSVSWYSIIRDVLQSGLAQRAAVNS